MASIALFSTLSIIFDLIPSIRAPWGMKVDFVGTIWVLCFYLYGLTEAFFVSSITAIYITIFSATGFVGAAMKFIATAPMYLIPAIIAHLPFFSKREAKMFSNPLMMISAGVFATLVRLVVASLVNLYWAVPLWWGIEPSMVLPRFGGLVPFIIFVAGMNVLQSVVDSVVPWILAFKAKLSDQFGTW
jgi:riboflavin transporter FmnP